MKTRNSINRFLGILLIVGLIVACSKDGDVGPQGPVGQDGEDGEPGKANIIYSEWFPTEFGNNIEQFRNHSILTFQKAAMSLSIPEPY